MLLSHWSPSVNWLQDLHILIDHVVSISCDKVDSFRALVKVTTEEAFFLKVVGIAHSCREPCLSHVVGLYFLSLRLKGTESSLVGIML